MTSGEVEGSEYLEEEEVSHNVRGNDPEDNGVVEAQQRQRQHDLNKGQKHRSENVANQIQRQFEHFLRNKCYSVLDTQIKISKLEYRFYKK